MKPPAKIKPWMSQEEMVIWLREAPTKQAYQKRLTIWLTATYSYNAGRIADMLQVSRQAVWMWIGQYNKKGPEGLARLGRGGTKRAYLTFDEEKAMLEFFLIESEDGKIPPAKELKPVLEEAVGRKLSNAYVYKMLQRHKNDEDGAGHSPVKKDYQ